MKAKDVMTTPVISAGPETSVAQIATLLLERRISAVPVLEHGRLIGMVSEADLLHRHEIGTDQAAPGRWWLRLFRHDASPADYVRTHARQARDIMTRELVMVEEDAALGDIAALLETHGVKRVPVMRGDDLVGIVSRADLVRALAQGAQVPARPSRDDEAIQGRLLAELAGQPWWRSLYSSVSVSEGVVHYWGATENDEDRNAVRVAAENVPGVRGVEDHRISMQNIPSMI